MSATHCALMTRLRRPSTSTTKSRGCRSRIGTSVAIDDRDVDRDDLDAALEPWRLLILRLHHLCGDER